MSAPSLYSILRDALVLIEQGKFEEADTLLDTPFTEAFKAETNEAVKKAAESLHGDLHNAKLPAAHNHIQPFAKTALELLPADADNMIEAMNKAQSSMHHAMHDVDKLRTAQATALTQHEAALRKEKGFWGYNLDLVKRRFGAEDSYAGKVITLSEEAITEHSHDAGHNHDTHDHHHSHGSSCNHTHHAHDKPHAKEVTLKGSSLEEFGTIKQLNTTGRKFAFGACSAVGLGLFVHGGQNVFRAFSPVENENIEVGTLGQTHEEGVNYTRLGVGVAEALAGAALAYRMATGRLGLGAVKGQSTNIMGCAH